MAYQPYAVERSAVYTLTGADGTVAVFNDPTSGNYVGMLSDLTGLDSAEVRENAADLVASDGRSHGYFYLGGRPITMTVEVFNHNTIAERTARIDRARRASLALRGDADLRWTDSSGVVRFTTVRRQQPFRESGGWAKQVLIPLVSEYAVLFGASLNTSAAMTLNGAAVVVENKGNYPAYPILNVTGPGAGTLTNLTLTNGTVVFRTTGLTLAATETVQFDLLNHTGVFTNNAGGRNGQSANQYINFTTTGWPAVLTGNNSYTLAGTGGGTATISWRDTWA